MPFLEYAAEATVGTTAMTAFSYLISASFRKLFSEPALINYVVSLSKIELKPKLSSVLGWVVHYAIGMLFVIAYHLLWLYDIVEERLVWALVLGVISGIIGIIGWIIIFSLPRKEPHVAFTEYYIQLFFAHVIFAVAVFWVHLFFSKM